VENEENEAEPHSMWEYPCRALTDVFHVLNFDFQSAIPDEKREIIGNIEFTRWAEWKPSLSGELWSWKAMLHHALFPNDHTQFIDFLNVFLSTNTFLFELFPIFEGKAVVMQLFSGWIMCYTKILHCPRG
jgi:hypothetical protein